MEFFNVGALEMVFLLGLAIIIIGPQKTVELAGQIGRIVANLRRNLNVLTEDLRSQLEDERRALRETKELLAQVNTELRDADKEAQPQQQKQTVAPEQRNGAHQTDVTSAPAQPAAETSVPEGRAEEP
jgi:Sec-independent protein translocase protein TatA